MLAWAEVGRSDESQALFFASYHSASIVLDFGLVCAISRTSRVQLFDAARAGDQPVIF